MPTPGAARSGLARTVPAAGPSPSGFCHTTGPRPENVGTRSLVSIGAHGDGLGVAGGAADAAGRRAGVAGGEDRHDAQLEPAADHRPEPRVVGGRGRPRVVDDRRLVGGGRVAVGVGHPLGGGEQGAARCRRRWRPSRGPPSAARRARRRSGRRRRCRRPSCRRCGCRGRCRRAASGCRRRSRARRRPCRPGPGGAALTPVSMVPIRTPSPRRPKALHDGGGVDGREAPVAAARVGEGGGGGVRGGVGDAAPARRGRPSPRPGRPPPRGSRRACPRRRPR